VHNMFCNGEESCDEENNVCLHSGDPCLSEEECNEEDDICKPIEPIPSVIIIPDTCYQSRWIPLPVFFNINVSNANFYTSSLVSFDPVNAILTLPPMVMDEENIFMISLLMPQWLTGQVGCNRGFGDHRIK